MLRNREVWLRKSSCMNDYMEVEHGLQCLESAYWGDSGKRFQATLNAIFEGICKDIESLFDSWQGHFRSDTYLMCVSEHDDQEDDFGRLSMWRAYSEGTGVALVLNNTVFLNPSDALKAYTSPVAYMDNRTFAEELHAIADAIQEASDFVYSQGREATIRCVFDAFKFASLCTKHPGFREKQEWRVVYSPSIASSVHLIKDIRIIKGIPQPIYKIPLRDIPDEGFVGTEIPSLLNRLIIGPSQYPGAMREAFLDLLSEAGIPEPSTRVCVSSIPLR
jgi:hypothetical protein